MIPTFTNWKQRQIREIVEPVTRKRSPGPDHQKSGRFSGTTMHVKADRSGAMILLAVLALGLSACNSKWVMGSDDVRASPTPVAAAPAAPRPAAVEPASILPVPVVLAALVDDDLAARLSRADQMALERTTQTTLESVPIGTESRWNNPESGHAGTITPTRTYQRPSGQYCREFTQVVILGGRSEETKGTACREPDGSWRRITA